MKNTIKNLGAAFAAILAALILMYTGFNAGVEYALTHSEIYVSNDAVYVQLDGDVYEHYLEEGMIP